MNKGKEQSAFDVGRRAFYRGAITNPYRSKSNQYREWERGFNNAYFENLERVKQREGQRTSAQPR